MNIHYDGWLMTIIFMCIWHILLITPMPLPQLFFSATLCTIKGKQDRKRCNVMWYLDHNIRMKTNCNDFFKNIIKSWYGNRMVDSDVQSIDSEINKFNLHTRCARPVVYESDYILKIFCKYSNIFLSIHDFCSIKQMCVKSSTVYKW